MRSRCLVAFLFLLVCSASAHASGLYVLSRFNDGLATGDVNGDRIPDIIALAQPGGFTIWLGTPNGLFAPPITQSNSLDSVLAVGDLNNDGRTDVVGLDTGDSRVEVYLANADGSLTAQPFVSITGFSTSLALGDLNGDGRLDLILSIFGASQNVGYALGNGDGTFSSVNYFTVPGQNGDPVIAADLNGDGHVDIALAHPGSVTVSLGDGSGGFTTSSFNTEGPYAFSITAGDLNGDNRPDLVIATDASTGKVYVQQQDGSFTFKATIPGISSGFRVAIADVDADGKKDVITSGGLVFLGNGDGTLQPPKFYGPGGAGPVLADLDGDGVLDLAMLTNSDVSILRGNGNGTFSQALADTDVDGKSDVVWQKTGTGENAQWLMNGTTIRSASYLPTVSDSNWVIAGSGDLNGDLQTDLVWLNSVTGQVVVWNMSGGALQSAMFLGTSPGSAWNIAGVGDFNAAGRSDILWHNATTGENQVWLMDDPSQVRMSDLDPTDPNQTIVATADFDGDGFADILWHNDATGEVSIWLMTGEYSFNSGLGLVPKSSIVFSTIPDASYKIAAAGDVDGDGIADIVWWNDQTGDVVVWLLNDSVTRSMRGPLRSAAHVATVSSTDWRIQAAGDFDRDGKTDLLWRNVSTGDVVVWLMDGAAIKQGSYVTTVSDPNWSIAQPR